MPLNITISQKKLIKILVLQKIYLILNSQILNAPSRNTKNL